jgi:hypothetical protein
MFDMKVKTDRFEKKISDGQAYVATDEVTTKPPE